MFKRELAGWQATQKDYEGAARTLESINLEQTNRNVSEKEKVEVYLEIAQNWLEEEDYVNASNFVNKAAHIMHLVEDVTLQLTFKSFQAKLLDTKRKFHLAAWEFYRLSNYDLIADQYEADEQLEVLKAAMTCAILSPASDMKVRLLGVIYKDERSQTVLPHHELVEKLHMGVVVKKAEVAEFESKELKDYQKTTDQDGYTVLQKALLEHNI